MKLIIWQDNFATGVPSVDFDHKEMIGKINEALEGIYNCSDTKEISKFLGTIHVDISAHFALEEKLMAWSGYGEYRAHKKDHEKLLDEIRDIMDSTEGFTETMLETQLADRLIDWFTNHFSSFDARLHGYFD